MVQPVFCIVDTGSCSICICICTSIWAILFLETHQGHHISNIFCIYMYFFSYFMIILKAALVYVIIFEHMYWHAQHNLLSILMLNVKVEESCVFFLASNNLTHLPPLKVKPKQKSEWWTVTIDACHIQQDGRAFFIDTLSNYLDVNYSSDTLWVTPVSQHISIHGRHQCQ